MKLLRSQQVREELTVAVLLDVLVDPGTQPQVRLLVLVSLEQHDTADHDLAPGLPLPVPPPRAAVKESVDPVRRLSLLREFLQSAGAALG